VFASHLIILDGRLVGGWRRLLDKKTVIVETRLLVSLSAPQRKALTCSRGTPASTRKLGANDS
jgi:hypothetical protein